MAIDIKKATTFVAALGPWGWGALAFGAVAALIWGALVFVIEPEHRAVLKAQAHVQQATTTATATATKTVVDLVQKNADTTAKVRTRQAENARVIERLPSSTTAIPDSDADAFVRGLCLYNSTSGDSACNRLSQSGH